MLVLCNSQVGGDETPSFTTEAPDSYSLSSMDSAVAAAVAVAVAGKPSDLAMADTPRKELHTAYIPQIGRAHV